MSLLNGQRQILRAAPPLPGMDYAALLRQGVAACQALSGALWTDYNEHDPGRTTLEALCYALTDLGFRCDFPVADVLAEQPDAWRARYSTLYPGPRILTSNAITANDYRKLIMDQAFGAGTDNFKNVWVRASGNEYTIAIEAVDPARDPAALCADAAACFDRHRNTGEQRAAGSPRVLALCPVEVSATVELAADADAEAVAANLLFALQDSLVPFVQAVSVACAMAAGVAPEQIFDGPPLAAGMLPDSALLPQRRGLTQSELAGAMLTVAGVVSLPRLQVTVARLPLVGVAAIGANEVARLAPSVFAPLAALPFQLVCGNVPVDVELARVQRLLDQRLAAAAPTAGLPMAPAGQPPYGPAPAGARRDIARYYSLQRQLPAIYGVGAAGLPLPQTTSAADVARQTARLAMARQYKAYLLLFEQWLADAQAQLAGAGRLFSLDPAVRRSYFTQSLDGPDGPPDLAAVLRAAPAASGSALAAAPEPAPPPPPTRYVLHIHDPAADDDHGSPSLRSADYATRAEADACGARILARGGDPRHYRLRALSERRHQLWLADESDQPLAFGAGLYDDAAAAEVQVQAVAGLIGTLARSREAAARALLVVERGPYGVRLRDRGGRVLLEGGRLSAAGQARWLEQVLRFGTHSRYYHAQAQSGQRWRLVLADQEGRVFASGGQHYAGQAEAVSGIAPLKAAVDALCCDTAAQARQTDYLPPRPDDDHGHADADAGRVDHYQRGWAEAVRQFDPVDARHNRVLDHLLAQFCERFDDTALARVDPRPPDSVAGAGIGADIANAKRAFLGRYAAPAGLHAAAAGRDAGADNGMLGDWLGGARSRGGEREVMSGPLSRISLLLGMPEQVDGDTGYVYHDPRADRDGAMASMLPLPGGLHFTARQPAILRALLAHGAEHANYAIDADADGHALRFRWPGQADAATIYRAPHAQAAEQARQAALAFFREYPRHVYAGERLHAVEHHQLRTGGDADQHGDFYRHRASLVLPDWPARHQDPAFRAFAWQTAVENFPAHMALDMLWLNQVDMRTFDTLHGQWRATRAGDGSADGVDGGDGGDGDGGAAGAALARFLAGLAPAQGA